MLRYCLLALGCVVLSQVVVGSREILDPVSEKCKRIECPAYKTIKEHDGFEERRIFPGTWVCKKSTGCSPTQTSAAFMSLFYYISGSNSKNVKIDMTAPVIRKVRPADLDREGCDKEIKTCFWLPEKHQDDPPQPTEDGVFLYKSRGPVAYVLTYSGGERGRDEEFVRRAKEFMSKLDGQGLKYKREYVKSVGYDGPDVPDSKRVREIWLIKSEESQQPDWCNSECPGFTLESTTDDYEARRYESTKWVSTKVSSMSYSIASSTGFGRLFSYISGANTPGAKIEMTEPVLIKIPEETSWWFWKEYTVSFMLPREHWDNPPMPTNSDVYIDNMPAMTAYVKVYGGWANGWNTNSHRQGVEQKLAEEGQSFEDSFYFSAAYNAPFEMTNRRNEVWVLESNGRK
ncbi:uncharacterized protein LOC144879029 isoform X2 [Branchiostoma floridae x Branchiostoma japonicum]